MNLSLLHIKLFYMRLHIFKCKRCYHAFCKIFPLKLCFKFYPCLCGRVLFILVLLLYKFIRLMTFIHSFILIDIYIIKNFSSVQILLQQVFQLSFIGFCYSLKIEIKNFLVKSTFALYIMMNIKNTITKPHSVL